MLLEDRKEHIANAAKAAMLLDRHLTDMLDEYDLYIERHQVRTSRELQDQTDVLVSINALSVLPIQVSNRLDDWVRNEPHNLCQQGFELYVLNEFSLHLFTIATFLTDRGVEVNGAEIGEALNTLRTINRELRQ